MTTQLPFAIEKNDARPLVRQVEDGLRSAILSGRWAPGDRLPSFDAMARSLGVSRIVTKEAFRRIAEAGLVSSRQRIGTFVRDTHEKRWRGRVAFIYDAGDTGYFQTTLAESIRVRLNSEGVLFTRASVDRRPGGDADFSSMDAVLARSTDLALVLFDRDDVCRRLAKRGVPFATIGRRAPPDSAVGGTVISHEAAFRELAAWCRACGIREALHLSWFRGAPDATAALRDAGIRCRSRILAPNFQSGRLLGIEEAGFKAFRRMAATGRLSQSSLYFFTDDYLLRGAMQAFVGTGIRIPGDIRVATVVNAGSGPFLAQALPRVVIDAEAFGRAIADSALSFLAGRGYAGGEVGPKWVPGSTLPFQQHNTETKS